MVNNGPNFVAGTEAERYVTQADWIQTEDGLWMIPTQLIGRPDAKHVVSFIHGGPGGGWDNSQLEQFKDADGNLSLIDEGQLALEISHQRASGIGDSLHSVFLGGKDDDPVASHSLAKVAADHEFKRIEFLGGRKTGLVARSFGTAVAVELMQTNPAGYEGAVLAGLTVGEFKEALARYGQKREDGTGRDGSLANAVPEIYERFINAIPEPIRSRVRSDPAGIMQYYDEKMNPFLEGYDAEHARELAVAFGLLHIAAANPAAFAALADRPVDELYKLAKEGMKMNPDLFPRVSMNFFVNEGPLLSQGDARLLDPENMAKLEGMLIYLVSGAKDPITRLSLSALFARRARKAGANVTRKVVDSGSHAGDDQETQLYFKEGVHLLVA